MSIRTLNLETELQRLARGKRSTMPTREIARWALDIVKATRRNDEVSWLEELYALESGIQSNTK